LKRKSQKGSVAAQTKKYNYYVDNFEETKKRSTSNIPEKQGAYSRGGGEDTPASSVPNNIFTK